MARPYEEIEKIEILTEFISGVYGRQLNKVLKQGLEADDKSTFDGLLLHHLREMEYIDLFTLNMEELETLQVYWLGMDKITRDLY
ncbi:TPA: hypothetical protein ACIOW6_002013 [Streptococcus agalactiae]